MTRKNNSFRCLTLFVKLVGLIRRKNRTIKETERRARELEIKCRLLESELAHSHAKEKLARLGIHSHDMRAVHR